MTFPDPIQLPAVTAASLVFSPGLTARDQSILMLVCWYAAMNGTDENGMVDVPDADMRQALGGLRTIGGEREDGYYARLGSGAMRTDKRLPDLEDGVPVPVVAHGMRRVTIDGAKRWQVDPAIIEAFRLRDGEIVIELPLALLARARCRFTMPLYLRAAAWVSGDVEPHWILRKRARATEFKLSLHDLREVLGTDGKAAELQRSALAPAVLEIDRLTDTAIEYEMISKPSMSGPGKARAIKIMVGTSEIITYLSSRKPRTFSEIGKPPSSGQVLPFTTPFARRGTRKVMLPPPPIDDEDDLPNFMKPRQGDVQ